MRRHRLTFRLALCILSMLALLIAPAARGVGDVGRAADRAEIDDVAADMQVPRRVARMQDEALRRVAQQRLDHRCDVQAFVERGDEDERPHRAC